jgi:RND family efflux transporter MFP subunit
VNPGPVAVALVLAIGIGCSRKADSETAVAEPVAVKTAVVRLGTMVDRLTATGTVVVSRAAEFVVFAPEPAEIVEIPKMEGESVEAGDLLVRFDFAPLTAALSASEIAVAQSATRVESAKVELDKMSSLSERGLVARAALDAARAELIDAQAAHSRATGELNAVKARQSATEVRAKFAGVVTRRWHTVGDQVVPAETDPVIRVVDDTRLQVVAPLEKSDIVRLKPGRPATIAAPGLPPEAGTIASLPAMIEAGTRLADVRFSFAGPTTLKRDAVVDVDVNIEERPDVLIVPRSTVQREDDVTYVMVAGDDGLAHRRPVQVGFSTRIEIQILSGVAAGDRVITSNLDQLTEGTPVQIER